ncbi:MAG: hypothetical protein VB084_16395 [Syntrophomonadaceae bacterium]|nr:hypothetical protein [Syntrophomonadaceae bacterium]
MLLFQEKYEYRDPINVIFLCGINYGYDDDTDKRNVLKAYIEQKMTACQPIILEENFWFKKTNRQYFSYDDIFLKNLAHIEQLAALFAWKIIIIHESISTAAEIGTFAIDPLVAKKMCLLVPDSIAIEEKKLSSFIKLAFFANGSRKTNIQKKITYYPDIEIVRKSPNKSEYYTYFHNNEIGDYLGCKIDLFLNNSNSSTNVLFKKAPFGKLGNNENEVSYIVNHDSREIEVSIPPQVFKAQLVSLFFNETFRRSIRQTKKIYEHVSYIEKYYKEVLLTTIKMLSGEQIEGYEIRCKLQQTACNIRQATGYLIYMLQAAKFIALEQETDDVNSRKMTLRRPLENCRNDLMGMIYDIGNTTFGRLHI